MSSPTFEENLDELIDLLKAQKERKVQVFSRWVMAGAENYEKTLTDGRYRKGCNIYRKSVTCEDHLLQSLKLKFNHCDKLDCETCYTYTASRRAREINAKLLSFKNLAENGGVRLGNIAHIVLSPKKLPTLFLLVTYDGFKKLREMAYKILNDSGLFTAYEFFHLWSFMCWTCGEREGECKCNQNNSYWFVSPHFHALGFGYMLNAKEFRKKYKNWVYINEGRRFDAHSTAFYLLKRVAMWRKSDGNLTPAYMSYGDLRSKNFKLVKQRIKYVTVECKICRKVIRGVINGIQVSGDLPQFKNSMSLSDVAKELGIKTKRLSKEQITKVISKRVHNNKNFRHRASEVEMRLGRANTYKVIEKEYKFEDIEIIRRKARKNKERSKN